jgi:hypothetical protein
MKGIKLDDWQKEICQEIRNIVPHYEGKDDNYIYNYCGAVTPIEELICNKGYTIKGAVKVIFNNQ